MKNVLRLGLLTLTFLLAGVLAACQPSDQPREDASSAAVEDDVVSDPETALPTEATAEVPTEEPTQAVTEPETLPPNAKQLIPDVTFLTGMDQISQKDHANHDKFTVLKTHSFYDGPAGKARWRLAQWDSGPCMVENEVDQGRTVITDGQYRTFGYDPDTDVMTFRLDTSLFYQGKPALSGMYWPHLLIEQGDFGYKSMPPEDKAYYSCAVDHLVLSMDIRLTDYSLTPVKGDWVEAAQFLLYFYVKGVETNDFCWFGVQLFDNRWARNSNYIGYDGGKADASGAMIFSVGSQYVYPDRKVNLWANNKPNPCEDWIHVELDLRHYLDQMLRAGKADGYFKAQTLEELCINGMNLGWETIGTFDHTMQIRHLRLVSYMDE